MTIASAISNAQAKVADAYTAVSGMGGTLPATQNLSNLPTAINSIPAGSPVEAKNFYNLGGVTITSNVSTGFGPSKGILIPNTLDGQYSTCEVGVGFSSTDITASQIILGEGENSGTTTGCYSIALFVDQSKLLMFLGDGSSYNIASTYGTSTLSSNTRYYVKIEFDGSTYTLKSSTDNTNWTTEATVSSATKVGSSTHPHMAFGFGASSFSRPGSGTVYDSSNYFKFQGSIYFDNCYIKTDGNDLWTPFQEPFDYDIRRTLKDTSAIRRRYAVPTTGFDNFFFPYYFRNIGPYAFCYAYHTNDVSSFKHVDMSAIESVDNYGLYNAFSSCTGMQSLDLSGLTSVRRTTTNACGYMCSGCSSLTSVDLSNFSFYSSSYPDDYYFSDAFSSCINLETVSLPKITVTYGNYALQRMFSYCTKLKNVTLKIITVYSQRSCAQMFQNCTALQTIDLSTMKTVSGQYGITSMFAGCSSLSTVDFSGLEEISGNYGANSIFQNCTSLGSITFTKLKTLTGAGALQYAFQACTSLTSVSFPALTTTSFGAQTTQFNTMLNGCTGVTVHFPAAIQSTIGSWTSVTSGFGGTNTTVLFDL